MFVHDVERECPILRKPSVDKKRMESHQHRLICVLKVRRVFGECGEKASGAS